MSDENIFYKEEYYKTVHALEAEHFVLEQIAQLCASEDLEQGIGHMLKELGEYMGADRIYIFENYEKCLSNTFEWCAEGVEPQIDNLQEVGKEGIRHWVGALESGQEILIRDVEEIAEPWKEEYKLLKSKNIKSCIEAPIILDNCLIGFIGVDNAPTEISHIIKRLLTTIGYFIAICMKNQENKRVLEIMGYSDQMTGCSNRNAYISKMEMLKKQGKTRSLGACICDLNGLKTINDAGGHMIGDEAICDLAKGLISIFDSQNVYRIGGDEFAVLLPDVEEEDFERQIQQIREDAFPKWGVSVSLGHVWQKRCKKPEELIRLADERMYNEKKQYYLENGQVGE